MGPVPLGPDVEYELVSIDDPYGQATPDDIVVFRRPLIATNLIDGTPIMWDGREPSLQQQANDATLSHAQATQSLPDTVANDIAAFQLNNFTAQIVAYGRYLRPGGGDPIFLSSNFPFINQNASTIAGIPGPNQDGAPQTQNVFTLYDIWQGTTDAFQQSVLRGRDFFNGRNLRSRPPPFFPTCSICHSALNHGSNDLSRDLLGGGNFTNTNVSGGGEAAVINDPAHIQAILDAQPDLPKFTYQNKVTGHLVTVTDPGRGHISGKWLDIGRFKVPTLRGIGTHAPYFHNGQASTLRDAVLHYNEVFASPDSPFPGVPFTDQETDDVVAFLQTL
jgi:cytochrome c peroxidase